MTAAAEVMLRQRAFGARTGRPWAGPLLTLIVALASASGGLWLAHQYPLAPWGAPLLFVAAAGAFGAWPAIWPIVLPALLPVIGFAPWTGWISFEEWDLLVLAIATGGYLRQAGQGLSAHPRSAAGAGNASQVVWLVVALFAGSTLLSMLRGYADAGGYTFGLFEGYREPMNSLRLAKSLFAALLLYPLWRAAQRRDPAGSARRLSTGLALGLLATSLAATWERLAFTGLLNFSTDYRTTALFWEMHVGGAALDAMLSLTMPFAVRELITAKSRSRWLLMAAILLIAAYASLTTFSRDVYLSIPVGVAVMLAVHARQPRGTRVLSLRQRLGAWLPGLVLLAAFAWAAAVMFPGSGYRGLIALLGGSALLLALPHALRGISRATALAGCACGVLLAVCAWAATAVEPKAAYFSYGFAGLLTAAMLATHVRAPTWKQGRVAPGLALSGFIAILAATALVARHWGGPAALTAALPVIAVLPLILLVAVAAPLAPWPAGLRWQATVAAAMVLVAGTVAALDGSYMTERFSTSNSDFGGRLVHWRRGLAMLQSPHDVLFGRGLGRFVDSYAFVAPADQIPGDYRLRSEGKNRYLTLAAGTQAMGWGELLRLSQRVALPTGPTFVRLDVRSEQAAWLHLEVCFKHLLYSGGCLVKQVRLPARPGVWQTVQAQLDGAALMPGAWYAPQLVMFSMATENPGLRVDIDNVALLDASGRNLLTNGDFSADLAHWFMTSDRNHLPWHIKNLVANVMLDQGLIGLVLLALLVAAALARMTLGPARTHPLAPGVAGGLAGFLVVGVFDSLLDVPRVAFLFYLLVLLGLTLRPPPLQPLPTPAG